MSDREQTFTVRMEDLRRGRGPVAPLSPCPLDTLLYMCRCLVKYQSAVLVVTGVLWARSQARNTWPPFPLMTKLSTVETRRDSTNGATGQGEKLSAFRLQLIHAQRAGILRLKFPESWLKAAANSISLRLCTPNEEFERFEFFAKRVNNASKCRQ